MMRILSPFALTVYLCSRDEYKKLTKVDKLVKIMNNNDLNCGNGDNNNGGLLGGFIYCFNHNFPYLT